MSATLVGTVRGLFGIGNLNAQVNPFLTASRGFVLPPTRNGVGDHTLTLKDGLVLNDDGGGVCLVTPYGSIPVLCSVEQLNPTQLRVRTSEPDGDPIDVNLGILIQDVGPA